MPRTNTPPKHKTPNYRLVTRRYKVATTFGFEVTREISTWEAAPLRADRKDLKS